MTEQVLDLVWGTDDNYVLLAGVSITSVLENNKGFNKIRIWILDDAISEKGRKELQNCVEAYGREIYFLDMASYVQRIKETGAGSWGGENRSFSCYSRIFIADILSKYHIDKVLYCDCDLIINDSLEKLWKLDLGGKAMGMVKEYNRVEIRDLLGLKRTDSYYQSGMMIIDIPKWRELECTEKVLYHMQNVCASYPFVDQDLINCVLHDEIFTLPPQYNVNPRALQFSYRELCFIYGLNENNYYSEKEFEYALRKNKPVVYHCSDPCGGKPWQLGNHHIWTSLWDKYYYGSSWSKYRDKMEYAPSDMDKKQYWLFVHLPHGVYVIVLRFFSKRAMKKLVRNFGKNKIAESREQNE